MSIGILGGTGKEGQGLALRWAGAGVQVLIGSREQNKADRVASELNSTLSTSLVRGVVNREAAALSQALVSVLPYQGQRETLAALQPEIAEKLLMVATVRWPPGLLEKPSAAEEAQEVLGPEARVVAAFQTVSALALRAVKKKVEDDVLVCGDQADARREAVDLIALSGLRALEIGPLRNARVVEALTGILLELNKNYHSKLAGIRITGLGNP